MIDIFKNKIALSPEPMNDIFEFIEKPYSLRINSHFKPEDSNDKIWNWNRKIFHQIFFQMNVKLSSSLWTLTQNKNPGPRKLSSRVMQNIYSPNRFYLTFSYGNFWSFDKILNITKKTIFTIIYKCMIFPLGFGWF